MLSEVAYQPLPRHWDAVDPPAPPGTVVAETRERGLPGAAVARPQVRVLIADRTRLVLAGLRFILRGAQDLEIVGEAQDGFEAVRLATQLEPDVIILDLTLPGRSGLEVMREVRARVAGARTLVLSQRGSEDDLFAAFEAGAAGYLLKDDDLGDLAAIVRGVHAGRLHLSAHVSGLVVREYVERGRGGAHAKPLTERQSEILSLIARGRTSREVGALLGITLRTVQTHRWHIMRRLHVHTEAGLVHAAMRLGLLPSE